MCQSSHNKLAGCSYRKSLENKREIHVYSYYTYTYVSMSAMYGKEKTNQITFRHKKRDLSIRLFYMYKDDNLHDD
jgi:hypothetical protein